MYIVKQKQTHRHRKQTNGYQWGEGNGEEKDTGMKSRETNYQHKGDKHQGYVAEHREL